MKEAENFVNQYPDSALILLNSIPYPSKLNKKRYARYLLLLVEAKDKADKDISSDTLIFTSINYFQSKNDYDRQAKAEFYCGRVYHSQKEYKKGEEAYLRAEKAAQKTDDNDLKGLIQYFFGSLYYDQRQYLEAIPKFERAQKYFIQSPHNYKWEISTCNLIGNSFFIKKMNDSALVYFEKALNLAEAYNDSNQIVQVRLNLARIYSDLNQRDSAEYLIRLALDSLGKSENFSALSNAYRTLSLMEEKAGNYKKALQYHQAYSKQLSNLFIENNKRNLLETEKTYNFELLQREKNRLWIERQWAIIILLILLGFVCMFFFRFYRKAANNRAIYLEKELEELFNSKDREGNKLRSLSADYLDVYRNACMIEREMGENKQLSGKDFVQKMNKILYGHPEHDWDKLYQIMNESYKGFFSQLKQQYPQLTESEFRICCLTYAGFDNTEIALHLELSKNTIQHRKSEIRQKLKIEGRGDIKLFLDMHVNRKKQ
ncbi:MAG: LuxR C-terminal-related transcriptional regulator [Candidatus Azobacteroides sp.]|nr:LuxR C-terminal-related transcriptional regulator [Candidatus Azobacteroides sp.]